MDKAKSWWQATARREACGGWLACGLVAALFLAPALARGGFGPADMLLGMTPWSLYRDQVPEVRGVANPQLDVIQQYVPWRLYAARQLRAGIVPWWNPHEYCGQPFAANVLSAVFYPFCWLAVALPIGVFFLLSAWLHLTLAGGGMWLLLRRHGCSVAAALTGAVVAMLNTYVVGWLAYASLSQWTYAWAPLLLYSWHVAWTDERPGLLAWTGLMLGLVVLGGHVQIAFYVGLVWLIYAGATVLADRRRCSAAALVRYLGLPLLAGGALALVQLLPAFELTSWSGRARQPLADALGSRLPASMLVLLVAPWFYGHNALDLTGSGSGGLFWGPYTNGVEASCAAGATALGLAVAALVWRREPVVWIFAGIVLVGLLLAFGTPFYAVFYYLVPGFSSLRGLARAFAAVNLGLAALSAFGLDALREAAAQRRGAGRVAGAWFAIVAGLLLCGWAGEAGRSAPERMSAFTPALTGYVLVQSLAALVCGGAVALVMARGGRGTGRWLGWVVAGELFWLGFSLNPGCSPRAFFFDTPETRYLAEHAAEGRLVGVPASGRPPFLDWMPMNTPMAYGIASPCGSESLSFASYQRLLAKFWRSEDFSPRLGHPLLDLVGARYVLSRADLSGQAGLRRVAGERCGVYENARALPLVFGTTRWHAGGFDELERRLAAPGYDPREVVVSEGPEAPASATAPLVTGEAVTPQRQVAAGEAQTTALVVWSSVAVPGWRVWSGGRPARILRADGVFQAVAAEPGRIDVRWVYQPVSVRVGLFGALWGIALLCAWAGLWTGGER